MNWTEQNNLYVPNISQSKENIKDLQSKKMQTINSQLQYHVPVQMLWAPRSLLEPRQTIPPDAGSLPSYWHLLHLMPLLHVMPLLHLVDLVVGFHIQVSVLVNTVLVNTKAPKDCEEVQHLTCHLCCSRKRKNDANHYVQRKQNLTDLWVKQPRKISLEHIGTGLNKLLGFEPWDCFQQHLQLRPEVLHAPYCHCDPLSLNAACKSWTSLWFGPWPYTWQSWIS